MNVTETAVAVSAVLGAAAAIGLAVRWLHRKTRGLDDFLDDWSGSPSRPGVPEQPGVMARLARIDAELRPNHGTSLRDSIDRIEHQLGDHIADPDAHHRESTDTPELALGRTVHYRGREGLKTVRAAVVTATVDTLDPRGVEAGHIAPLDSATHVHLWVHTPGRTGFAETNIPYAPTPDGPAPGGWCWPGQTRTGDA